MFLITAYIYVLQFVCRTIYERVFYLHFILVQLIGVWKELRCVDPLSFLERNELKSVDLKQLVSGWRSEDGIAASIKKRLKRRTRDKTPTRRRDTICSCFVCVIYPRRVFRLPASTWTRLGTRQCTSTHDLGDPRCKCTVVKANHRSPPLIYRLLMKRARTQRPHALPRRLTHLKRGPRICVTTRLICQHHQPPTDQIPSMWRSLLSNNSITRRFITNTTLSLHYLNLNRKINYSKVKRLL